MSDFCKRCGKPVSKGMQLCEFCEEKVFEENTRRFKPISGKRNKILLIISFVCIILAWVLIIIGVNFMENGDNLSGSIIGILGAISAFLSTFMLSVVGVEVFYK